MNWTLTETEKYCPETMHAGVRDSLVDCQTYCETNGARRLTFFPNKDPSNKYYCRCCTASTKLSMSAHNGQIYTLPSNYMYLPTI